jgi:hypothetical protein
MPRVSSHPRSIRSCSARGIEHQVERAEGFELDPMEFLSRSIRSYPASGIEQQAKGFELAPAVFLSPAIDPVMPGKRKSRGRAPRSVAAGTFGGPMHLGARQRNRICICANPPVGALKMDVIPIPGEQMLRGNGWTRNAFHNGEVGLVGGRGGSLGGLGWRRSDKAGTRFR